VKIFKKPKSRFCCYDFTVRGQRHRGSTQETKAAKAAKVAGLKLAHVIEGTDPFPNKPIALAEFAERFLAWLEDARLEDTTTTYYRNGWRLLRTTTIARVRLDQSRAIAPRGSNSLALRAMPTALCERCAGCFPKRRSGR